ncbi:MAG: flavin reductase family protein [Balneolaceae bacterium]
METNRSEQNQAEDLIAIMRRMPYPVTIITAASGKNSRGITIGSFTSLSISPPLISFNVERSSQMHSFLLEADYFIVHIPEVGQEDLCTRFALSDLTGTEQFHEVNFELNRHGVPVIRGVIAALHCRKYKQMEVGDHSIFAGEVLEAETYKDNAPILYLDGGYHSLPG